MGSSEDLDGGNGTVATGGCFCGYVRYRIRAAPLTAAHCHCVNCRKASGAPVVTWAEYPAGALELVSGEPREIVSPPESGSSALRSFCPRCGTQLTWRHDAEAPAVDVTAGSLDAPELVVPDDHVWTSRQLPWLRIVDGLPRHERQRP